MEQEVLKIIRLINLVTIDTCDPTSLKYESTADPLKKIVYCRLNADIQKELHTFLRKTIKKTVLKSNVWIGKISFDNRMLTMSIYKKRLREPAYKPED